MKTFRDTAGREWAIAVDVNAIKRVQKTPIEFLDEPLKVNLLAIVEPDSDLLKKLAEYPPLVCDIAYALCKPQCDAKDVSDEEFGRAMGGDVLEKVLEAIIEETIDFFPQARRTVLRRVLEKSQVFAEKVKTLTAARLAAGDRKATHDARQKQYAADLKKSQDEFDAAKKEWDATRDQAAKARAAMNAPKMPEGGPGAIPDISGNVAAAMATTKTVVEGTYSGYALAGLGTGNSVEEKMEKHLAKISESADRQNAALERLEQNMNAGLLLV
jgi:hypothetical protein